MLIALSYSSVELWTTSHDTCNLLLSECNPLNDQFGVDLCTVALAWTEGRSSGVSILRML